jgi:glycosyltransferase involved in cell wall biosynthesis
MVSAARIGVVLPSRESFTLKKSGAVALCAQDFARFSRYADRIEILGAGPCEYEDVRYRRLDGWRRWWRRERDAYARAVAAVAADYALLEVQNRPYLLASLRRRAPGVKFALHLHNDPRTMDGSRSIGERERLLAICDAVYCVSEFIRGRFLEGVADNGGKTITVLNGVPLPKTKVAKAPIIAFTGRVTAIKGVVELVGAFLKARPAGWRLVIAGSDPEGLLSEIGDEGIDLLGQVSHAEAMDLLARAEIAVVPSRWDDPCPRAAIEALAQGCALLTSRRGGLPEIAEGAALFVDPNDSDAFAKALARLVGDEGLRRDLQLRARERARSRFEIGAATARLDAARARCLGEG